MFEGRTIIERKSTNTYETVGTLTFTGKRTRVTVKPGLVTDGASIPRLFWTIIGCPMDAKFIGSSIIHDGLYATHKMERHSADSLFKEMLKDNKVGLIRRNAMHLALYCFGWIYFNRAKHTISKYSKFVTVS